LFPAYSVEEKRLSVAGRHGGRSRFPCRRKNKSRSKRQHGRANQASCQNSENTSEGFLSHKKQLKCLRDLFFFFEKGEKKVKKMNENFFRRIFFCNFFQFFHEKFGSEKFA
jgi:hypothetical protein